MYDLEPTVFLLLLLLEPGGLSMGIPPPANLTIECHNFRTVAYWNYSRPSLHPRFNVELFPYGGASHRDKSCLNITHQHCDVSKLVLGDIQDAYFLSVEAVVGSNLSDGVPSSEFTYNINEIHEMHCSVDFPPVDLSVQADGTLRLQFPHPFNFYSGSLRHLEKKGYSIFTYKVHFEEQEQELLECRRKKDPCEGLVPIPEGQERACLLLEGKMNNIQITTAEKICLEQQNIPRKAMKDDWSVLVWPVVVTAVALVVVAMFVILMFRRKTNSSSAFPKIMASVLANPQQAGRLLQPESDVTSEVLSVTPRAKPVQEPPPDRCAPDTIISEEGSRFPIGVETGSSGGFGQERTCDGPGRSEWDSMSEENGDCRGVESSGYDRAHIILSLEISPGDHVEGYKLTQA